MPSASPKPSKLPASVASAAVSPACRAMPARSVCSTASTSADSGRPPGRAGVAQRRPARRRGSPVRSACMPRRDAAKNATRGDPDSSRQQVERAQLAADGRAVEGLQARREPPQVRRQPGLDVGEVRGRLFQPVGEAEAVGELVGTPVDGELRVQRVGEQRRVALPFGVGLGLGGEARPRARAARRTPRRGPAPRRAGCAPRPAPGRGPRRARRAPRRGPRRTSGWRPAPARRRPWPRDHPRPSRAPTPGRDPPRPDRRAAQYPRARTSHPSGARRPCRRRTKVAGAGVGLR